MKPINECVRIVRLQVCAGVANWYRQSIGGSLSDQRCKSPLDSQEVILFSEGFYCRGERSQSKSMVTEKGLSVCFFY